MRHLVSKPVVRPPHPQVHDLGDAISPLVCPRKTVPTMHLDTSPRAEGRGALRKEEGGSHKISNALSIFSEPAKPLSQRARVQKAPGSIPYFPHEQLGVEGGGECDLVREEKQPFDSIHLPSGSVPSSWLLAQGRL